MAYTLAFYERWLSYGGSEEGGWWYETGDLVRALRIVATTEDEAFAKCRRANSLLNHLQRRKRSVSSVAYSGGRHKVDCFEGTPPAHTPTQRPYYS